MNRLRHRYGHAGLTAAPYGGRSLVDVDDRFFNVLPNGRHEYIVTDHGEHMGSVKKLKAGWEMSPRWATGRQKDALERAMRLVDLYKGGLP